MQEAESACRLLFGEYFAVDLMGIINSQFSYFSGGEVEQTRRMMWSFGTENTFFWGYQRDKQYCD